MATHREIDPNGYMTVMDNPISKAGVFPYLGREVGRLDEPDRVFRVYRPAEELIKAADMFKLQPIIDDHQVLSALDDDTTKPEEKGVIGAIGEQVYFDAPYLKANLKIFAKYAKDLIESGKKIELSPAYAVDYEPESGEFEGEKYDYVQRIKSANHLALVDEGRTGRDVRVLDSASFALDTNQLIKEAVMPIEEIIAACAALSDEDMAKLREALGVASALDADPEPAKDEEPAKDAEPAADPVAEPEPAKDSDVAPAVTASDIIEKIEEREDLIEMAKDSGIELSRKGLKTVEDVAKAIAKQEGLTACDSATVKGYLLGKQKASIIMVADAASVVEPVSVRSFYKKG